MTHKPLGKSLYRNIVEQSQGLICVHDLDGVLRYTNPLSAAELGFTPDQLIGRDGRMLLEPAIRPLFDEYLQRIKDAKVDSGVLRLRGRDGELRLWAYRNVLRGEGPDAPYVIGHAVDITEHWRTKQKLRESEQRSSAVLASLEEGIVFCGADGTVKECNASAERILGAAPDRVFGLEARTPPWRIIAEDGKPFATNARPDVVTLRTGRPCLRVVLGLEQPGGTLWLEVNSQPILGKANAAEGVVVSFADITERRRRETEREQELKEALAGLKVLRGLLSICASCKRIRTEDGSWQQIESYIRSHSEAEFSHGLCPACLARLDPSLAP